MQYVVLRRDMWTGGPGAPAGAPWPLGAVAAQAAHAATAALWESRASPDTLAYCDEAAGALDAMTKVVLEVADGQALADLAGRLAGAGVGHRVWVEQPEGVPTALASAPARKSVLQPHFKAGKLCRAGIGGK
jgi:peptidyl-tRNA hydrolase